ncbi:LOW QUALITY PROTEIN: dynein heavy chain domain-containing protein 1 [Chrysemys picta bellii]|uniref:LOW QUALITY PROTEIN: dynein heavy chain domain-containing protein 1 n=1 Tax=Chrysemys picta bellii TaxID=8478 RepID=UPI0032B23550
MRKAVLRVHLVFDADSQLVPFPSSQVLETSLLGALEAVVESVLQVTRTRKEKPVTQPEQSPGETETSRSQDLAMVLCNPQPSALREADKGGPEALAPQSPEELLQSLPAEVLCGQQPQLVHHLDLKGIGGLEVSGHRLRSQYPVPSREQLEQDLRSDSSIQGALASQRALQAEALSETQEICKQHTWVAEIHSFAHSWSPKQLELMKGWPAGKYVQRVVQLRAWAERVREVPSMVITCNRLLLVDCSSVQQEIVPLLDSVIKEIVSLLLSETSQRSEILISQLSGVVQLYQRVSTDIFTIAKCSQKLEQYQDQMTELQERVEYVRALNEVIRQHFRPLSLDEENLENLLLDTWEAFVYQQQEASDFIVSRRLSIIAELVDSLQRARQELQELLTTATTGQFLDPSQSPRAMEQELRELYRRFQAMATRVAELCRSRGSSQGLCTQVSSNLGEREPAIREQTDVSFVARSRGLIEAHEHVWRLLRTISEQITEWRCLAFSKFNTPLATEKMAEWQREASHMEKSLPANHPILQACVHMITSFQQFLPLLQKLASPLMKNSCWREFFTAMGVKCPVNLQFTLGQLLSYPLLEHSDTILKIWSSERGRCRSLDILRRLQKAWAERQFRLVNFILSVPYQAPLPDRARRPPSRRYRPPKQEYVSKDSGTFVLADTAELKALTEKSLLTLKNIILSPHTMELREEAESWTSTLRGFGALLDVWVSFQQKWIFLNIVLYEMDISLPSSELDCLFQKLDSRFRELMQVTSKHPLVLSSMMPTATSNRESRFMGVPLQTMLSEGVEDLQLIIHGLEYVLEATRMGFPRLFFLSNTEVVAMMASPAEPMEVTTWARRCFPTVHQLAFCEPSATRDPATYAVLLPMAEATGLVGACGETVPLCSPLLLNQKVTKWLCALEQRMKEALFHLLQACMAQRLALRPQLDVAFEHHPGPTELPLHLLVEHWGQLATGFPAQCVLLAEEALWFADVQERLFGPVRRPGLKLKHRLKLEALAHYVRNYRSSQAGQPGSSQLSTLLGALLTVTVRQRDVLAHLLQRKVDSPTAFAWAQLLKYRLVLHPESARAVGAPLESWAASPPGCWAEVLDIRLHYGYEYVGNCPHLVGGPQLERSFLGLLLALEEFRCGAALGCHGVGKTATMQHLARALGRQLVTLHCSQQMGLGCLRQHLSGAVQAGAWLLLEAVDQLGPGVLSGFSQLLSDLRMLCMGLQAETGRVSPSHRSKSRDGEGQEQPARALPELGLNEAEPYQPRVLGNILFGERLLRVRETYGCLATLQRLPELLRLALRPVALLPPDLHQVAEVTLLAAGFREAAHLAKKLSYFFWLEGELGPGPAPSRLALFKGVIEAAIGIVYPPVVRPEPEPKPGEQLPAQQSPFESLAEEPALIQALCLSPFLSALEDPRRSRVWELLRGVFPASCSLVPEAQAPPRLLSAVTAQLHEDKLHADPELTSTIVQLCQALLGSPGVLLVGPSGSGKTTAWKTLAKVLSRLAVSASLELAPGAGRPGTRKDVAYLPISTVCLCPNSLSTAEFLGRLEGGIWREGVFSRLLQRMASSAPAAGLGVSGTQQWLVLDGFASSEWLDPISSLFSAEPTLSLPNGQQLHPPEGVKFLFELPDASSISPSISTHCALLHCGGSCVWRALLASSLAPIYHTYRVSQESVVMLRGLAEDVFPPTLTFLQQHCSSVLQPHADLRSPVAWGIPETTAFTRLLKALLDQHLSHDKAKAQPLRREDQAVAENSGAGVSAAPSHGGLDEAVPPHHHLLVRSIFVFAYIWGFSGHLHPRHWAIFDSFARRVLYSSSYTIELPSADSVFDLYPQPEDGKLEVFDGKYLSGRIKAVPESFTILPQVRPGPRGPQELPHPAPGTVRPCELPPSSPRYVQVPGVPRSCLLLPHVRPGPSGPHDRSCHAPGMARLWRSLYDWPPGGSRELPRSALDPPRTITHCNIPTGDSQSCWMPEERSDARGTEGSTSSLPSPAPLLCSVSRAEGVTSPNPPPGSGYSSGSFLQGKSPIPNVTPLQHSQVKSAPLPARHSSPLVKCYTVAGPPPWHGLSALQYERLLYVLDLLLGSRQPVLLAGEPSCGKSSFAEQLIQPNHSYHRVAISPALGADHVRRLLESHVLSSMWDKALFTGLPGSRPPGVRGGRSCYLLLLDDLHAAELSEPPPHVRQCPGPSWKWPRNFCGAWLLLLGPDTACPWALRGPAPDRWSQTPPGWGQNPLPQGSAGPGSPCLPIAGVGHPLPQGSEGPSSPSLEPDIPWLGPDTPCPRAPVGSAVGQAGSLPGSSRLPEVVTYPLAPRHRGSHGGSVLPPTLSATSTAPIGREPPLCLGAEGDIISSGSHLRSALPGACTPNPLPQRSAPFCTQTPSRTPATCLSPEPCLHSDPLCPGPEPAPTPQTPQSQVHPRARTPSQSPHPPALARSPFPPPPESLISGLTLELSPSPGTPCPSPVKMIPGLCVLVPSCPWHLAPVGGLDRLLQGVMVLSLPDARQGSHPVVETLRQALSHQEVYGAESLELRHIPSAEFNCFGLVAAPAIGVHPLSPRFTRLCSILSLPSVSRESLICMHSPLVLAWLEKFPLLARHSELATALVGATVDGYEAVKARFRPSPACSPYLFSYHHIEKVLRGLFLLRPCPGIHLTSPLEEPSTPKAAKRGQPGISLSLTLSTRVIVRLWLHESLRTFCDPLLSESERQESGQLLLDVATSTFCTKRSVLRVISTSDREPQQRERARSVTEPAGQDTDMELGAESHEEPSSQSSSDGDCPDAFDPIDQAPALALDRPDTAPSGDSALGALEPEGAEATGIRRMASIQPSPALRPRFQEQHLAMGRRTSTRRTTPLKSKRRPSTKKENIKPLLPSHLLLLPGEDVRNILFSRELAPASSSRESLYHERCWDTIQQQLSTFLPRGFVLCREVTQHLVRLLRVLCCPEGHGALLSLHLSTGRRSLVAVAAHATASQLFELTGQAGEWEVRELIRKASWQAGILNTRTVVLVHQGVGPGTMQKLVDLMREGTYPGLYTAEDTAHIVKELLQENQNIKRTMRPNMVLQRFYQFVRNNLHMLLLLDGRKGWAQGRGPLGYPPAMATALLTLPCSIDVYQPWSQESLVQVATQHLEDALSQQPLKSPGEGLVCLWGLSLSWIMAAVQPAKGQAHLGLAQNTGTKCLALRAGQLQPMGPAASSPQSLMVSTCLSSVPASLQALENSLASIASAMALIHRSASCYATHLAPGTPLVTPKTFLDFLDAFLMLSAQLQRQSRTQADRMKLALTKMQAVSEKQREHSRDIKYLQEKLRLAKEQVARCQRRAEREEVVQKQQEQDCQHREARIEILTQEQHLLEQSKESATRKMNTEYKAALAGLQVQDIEELRSYRLPPASILRVTDTLCMMFSKDPGWESAKQLLGQEDFYQELLFYPKDELPNNLFQALGHVVSDESFCAASLQSVSKAAAALCQWICAIYWYHRALRIWEPTLMQLQHCKFQIRAEKGRLGDGRLQAEKLKELSSSWGLELLQATEHQEALARKLSHVLQEKEKADTVESSVAMHVANWTAAVKHLEQNCSTAQGDALLCAAALSYMGAFPPPRRQELLEKWQDICARRQSSLGPDDVRRLLEKELPCPGPAPRGPALLPVRQDFSLLALLSSEREQRAWDRDQKPQDLAGRQAALLLRTDTHACSRCWPLLLDPDQQALTWLLMAQKADEDESLLFAGSDTLSSAEESGSNEESPEKNLQVLSATDPRLEHNLLAAASTGLPILLLDFERSPCCPALLQLLQKETLLGAGGCTLHSESLGEVQVLPSFRLYLSTTLPLRALGKEMDHALLKGLTMIDLSLSQSALEDLLLGEVLRAERREAQTHWRMLQLSILQLEDKLEDTEVRRRHCPGPANGSLLGPANGSLLGPAHASRSHPPACLECAGAPRDSPSPTCPCPCPGEELLELISQPSRPLLQAEDDFLPLVRLLQTQLEALHASHQHLLSLRQQHLAVRAQYRQVACLGAALHQALQQVCRLHPQYQCSTASCLAVARRALLATKRADACKQEALAARLVELSKGLSRQLLAHAQPRLQEPHNLLLSFLGALAPLRLAGQLSPLDWLGFCQGLQAPAAEQLLQPARAARPGWVRPAAWRECGLLECLPGFQGLRASLAAQAAQWQEYFRLPATVVGPALSPSQAHLSLFQRAVLWRIFCPEKLCRTFHDLSTCLLGRPIAEDASYSAATLYTCSQTRLPLLFLTPPWGSPGAATHPLHWIRQMAKQRHCVMPASAGAAPGEQGSGLAWGGTLVHRPHGGRLVRVWPGGAARWGARRQRTAKGAGHWGTVGAGCWATDPSRPDTPQGLAGGRALRPALGTCPKQGHWLVLNNCHLQERWHPEVLAQLSKLQSTPEGAGKAPEPQLSDVKGDEIHPKFRLWLIAAAGATGPVPALRPPGPGPALPLVSAARPPPPRLLAPTFPQLPQGLSACCCSPRSEAELFTGLRLQERLAKAVSNPEEAMQELAGSILYGGYILDAGDAGAVQSLSQQCLGSASHLLPPRGVKTLLTALIRGSNLGREVPRLPSAPQGCREPVMRCMPPEDREGGWGWRSRDTGPGGTKGAVTDRSFLPPALSEEDVIADTRARMQQLPAPADPASCGLYEGLQQQLLESQSRSLLADLLRSQDFWQPSPPPSTQQEALGQLVEQGLEVVQALQDTLQQRGWEVGARGRLPGGRPRPKPRPLLRFLLEECGSFLALLQQVGRDLRCAQDQLQGRPCQSPRCSTILRALERGRLPRPWLPYVSTGPQDPSSWLQTLQCRCQLLCGYLGAVAGQPVLCYHLSAFQYPRRLLLALLQEAARAEKQDLDHYHLDQQVLPGLLPPSSPPESGLYLTGLELHNALWDTRSALLQETLSAQPCLLPPVWVQAVREAWRAHRPNAALPQYSCPIYLGLPQQPVRLSSQRALTHLALPCKMPPALCAQRRVHIVSTLPGLG